MIDQSAAAVFEAARPRLRSIAYRMVGVVADAEDVVQEAWVRWSGVDRSQILVPDAWLNTVTSRLALDHLRRRKREQVAYVGPWLPEPLVSDVGDPEATAVLADSLTMGFLMILERLSPDERAAFLLADVFSEPMSVIAETLERSEQACRQLASRGRRKLRDAAPERMTAPTDVARPATDEFLVALLSGDEAAALRCVHPEVRLISDGGAARHAARRPVVGPERVVRFMMNIGKRMDPAWSVAPANVGGLTGLVVSAPTADGVATELMMAFRVVDGRIIEVLTVLNPDKLSQRSFDAFSA